MRHSLPECLPSQQGRTMQPAVHYADGALVQTGDAALQTQASDPLNTITSVKRLMGRSLHDIQKQPRRLATLRLGGADASAARHGAHSHPGG